MEWIKGKAMRDWKKFENDEIFAVWKGYLQTEYPNYNDPLRLSPVTTKPIRLTPNEIMRLIEELMDRLEMKEKS